MVLLVVILSSTVVAIPFGPERIHSSGYTVEDVASPIANGTWHIRKNVIGIDFAIGPAGNGYTLGKKITNPEIGGDDLVIVKWDSEANVMWSTILDEEYSIEPYQIKVTQRGVIVSGTAIDEEGSKVLLAKWTCSGVLLWCKLWQWGNESIGRGLDIGPDGSVYTGCYINSFELLNWEHPEGDFNYTYVVLKYDGYQGELQWNESVSWGIEGWNPGWMFEITATPDGEIYAITMNDFLKRSGENSWIPAWDYELGERFLPISRAPSGFYYHLTSGLPYGAERFNETGYKEWWYDSPRIWEELAEPLTLIGAFTAALDDSVYFLFRLKLDGIPTFVIAKHGSDGIQLWNRSIEYNHDVFNGCIHGMEVSSEGLICIAYSYYDFKVNSIVLSLMVYQIGDFTRYFTSVISTTSISTSSYSSNTSTISSDISTSTEPVLISINILLTLSLGIVTVVVLVIIIKTKFRR